MVGNRRAGSFRAQETSIPLTFAWRKLPVLFDLSLELVDLKSVQLLGSHIH